MPATATVTTTSWTPTTDLKLGEYRVTVQAFNASGDSSVISAARTFLVQQPPIAIQPVQRVPDTTPTFTWTAVPGADRYELVVSKKWGTFDVVVNQSNLTTTTYTQPTALGLGRYTYRIRAINDPTAPGAAAVTSTYAAVYEFVIVEPPILTGPSLTTFSNHPTVSWVAPPNSETFDVYYRQVGGAQDEEGRLHDGK